jgi:glycosyltransferase involved in cell wall biosynthesis
MKTSIIICAYTLDRWDDLCAAVKSCHDQSRNADEVLLVVDYNDQLFSRATDEFATTRVLANHETKGLSGARNTGVAAATGDVLVFLDDDAFGEAEWLESLTTPFEDSAVCGVGGWVVPEWESEKPAWFPETFYWVFGCSYSGLPSDNAPIRNPIGANMALHRRVFDSVGGFSAGLGRIGNNSLGCEETELCIRYSTQFPQDRFVLRRDAVVHHRVPSSRLTWHYFWTRCWAEGLSKAAVGSLVGSEQGLSAERAHALKAMPRELLGAGAMLRKEPRAALLRVGYIVAGSLIALGGLLRGRVALRTGDLRNANLPS